MKNVGCRNGHDICERTCFKVFKRRIGFDSNKELWVISNTNVLKNIYTVHTLKNKLF